MWAPRFSIRKFSESGLSIHTAANCISDRFLLARVVIIVRWKKELKIGMCQAILFKRGFVVLMIEDWIRVLGYGCR